MGISSTIERPRERRVLLVAAGGMVSKRRRQGKRGNILLAMPLARSSRLSNFILQNSKIAFGRPASRPAPAGGMADKL